MSKIFVFGSMSVDLVTECERNPKKGETILGTIFFMTTGGKGANQAVAAARLGADVYMVGCVGDDAFGKMIIDNLQENNVNIDNVKVISDCASGTASIMLANNDNSIVVVPSANHQLTIEQANQSLMKMSLNDIAVIQNEIPFEIIKYVIEYCYDKDIRVIYNPAPYIDIPLHLLDKTTYFTPNETEVEALFSGQFEEVLPQYAKQMIVTVGEKGAIFYDDDLVNIPAYLQEVVDTTGAGDTFNGALAVGMSEGMSLEDAITFANKAAGLSVTGLGAQGGMPSRLQVEQL